MWNKKEMSQRDATLTRVPLTLTFDLELSRTQCIPGMGGPIVMERKGRESIGCPDVKHWGNESTGRCAYWGTFDLELARSNCISGMGGPIVMEKNGRELIACPDVKHNHRVTWKRKILLGTGVTKDVGVSVDSSSWTQCGPLTPYCAMEPDTHWFK